MKKGERGFVLFSFLNGVKSKVKGVKETGSFLNGVTSGPGVLYLSEHSWGGGAGGNLYTFFWSCKLSHFSISPSSLPPQIPPGMSDLCVNQRASSWNAGPDLTASVTQQGRGSRISLWVQKSPWKTLVCSYGPSIQTNRPPPPHSAEDKHSLVVCYQSNWVERAHTHTHILEHIWV